MNTLFLLILLLSGGLYLAGHYLQKPILKYIFKPFTTILILFFAFMQLPYVSVQYKDFILIGLVLSLFGDVFLLWPEKRFVTGLVAFLLAHILFILAITSDFGPYLNWQYLIPALLYMAIFLWIVLPKTGKMVIPVVVYAAVLMLFFWQATGRAFYLASDSSMNAFWGAFLFVISDSILAYDKFVKKFKWSHFFIHVTYWGALYFIALSV
ncbi:MAG: lysoplasmalogenase [Bacteroidales bacterium]|nr:lysoplasmalogenase [Bacteroidales bacterium]